MSFSYSRLFQIQTRVKKSKRGFTIRQAPEKYEDTLFKSNIQIGCMDYLLHSLHVICTHCFYVNPEDVGVSCNYGVDVSGVVNRSCVELHG